MAFKFCPNCGTKLDGKQNFCANCGYNITGIQSELNYEPVSNNESRQETQEYLIDVRVPAPFPIDGSGKMGRDYKEDRINQYKHLMGMNTGVQNTVVAEPTIGLSSAIAALRASWFILSFEDEGLVLIGVNKIGHFNNKNSLLISERIKTVKVHKGMRKKKLVFKTFNSGNIQFYINFALAGSPFQSQNYKNLENLVNKYNK